MSAILDFLDNWLENKGLIDMSDTNKLKEFMEGLGLEIDKLSINPPEGASKLILYGGMNGDVPMWKIAEGAANSGQGYYFISQTEAGQLISGINSIFTDKLDKICGGDDELIDKILGNPVNGERERFVEGVLSVNDRISNRLAQNATGDVIIWAPDCPTNKVLSDTELRAVLTNDKITSINGIPKETFIDTYKKISGGSFESNPSKLDQNILDQVFLEIKKTCMPEYFDDVKAFYNSRGKVIGIDVSDFVGGNPIKAPYESVFETTMGDIRNYISDAEISKLFPDVDFEKLSELEKLQLRQLELEYRRANGILDIDKFFITNIVKLLYK